MRSSGGGDLDSSRGLALGLVAAWLWLLGAGPVAAELSYREVEFDFTLEGFGVGASGPQTSLSISGTSSVGVLGGMGTTPISRLEVYDSLFLIASTLPAPETVSTTQLRVDVSNADGLFLRTTGQLRGLMALRGALGFVLFSGAFERSLPWTEGGTRGVGLGGEPVVAASLLPILSQQGATWSTGTAVLSTTSGGTTTRMGFVQGPASGSASTALAGGSLRLVTPALRVSSDLGMQTEQREIFATLTLRVVPEPASATGLVAGAALIAAAGARRRARCRRGARA